MPDIPRITVHPLGNLDAAVLDSPDVLIRTARDALDLMAMLHVEYGCGAAVLALHNLDDAFFDLASGLAGEVLQKFTNYRFRIAVTGDFDRFRSRNQRAFLEESNRGSTAFFVADTAAALDKLRNAG